MNNITKTKDMILIALFAVLIAVCSWISVPMVIPFTMQIFGVFFALSFLGGKNGTLCVIIYLMMGMIGMPVFSNGTAGIGIIMGKTGGYMIGWIFSGLVMWFSESFIGRGKLARIISMVAGLLVCYVFGTVWFMAVYAAASGPVGLWASLCLCVFPFVIPDMVKLGLAFWLSQRLHGIIKI